MGAQAAQALRLVAGDVRRVVAEPVRQTVEPVPEPEPVRDVLPLGVPAIAAGRLAADRVAERQEAEHAELLSLRARVAELEQELEHVRRQHEQAIADAVADVERRQHARAARTMGGRLPSITSG